MSVTNVDDIETELTVRAKSFESDSSGRNPEGEHLGQDAQKTGHLNGATNRMNYLVALPITP